MNHQDGLTGLLNRQGVSGALDAQFAQTVQKQETLSLMLFDIDYFKAFNEAHGHVAGDALIRHAAGVIRTHLPDGCLLGRYGGEEFLVALPNMVADDAVAIAEEIRKQFSTPQSSLNLGTNPPEHPATLSGGVASYPDDAHELSDLIRKTEYTLYRAKEMGRDRVCVYEDKDGLTGLLNHYSIVQQLDECIEAMSQKDGCVSVVFFDVNHFKQVNDEHGHTVGDQVLKQVASILRENFEGTNVVGRYGGDEFLVVLPEARTDTAFVLAEEVRRLIAETTIHLSIDIQRVECQIGVSGGIATYPADARERVDLVRKANEALYRAKQMGRNRICMSTSSQMITKTSHFTQTQLERLADLAKGLGKSEAFLLREALDDLLRKYDESLRTPDTP